MEGNKSVGQGMNAEAVFKAATKTFAIISFDTEGNILDANENFCSALGYAKHEIVGKHHRIFCDQEYVKGNEYRNFWATLARGTEFEGEFQRFTKSGNAIWIRGVYYPHTDSQGRVLGVVKIASDVTKLKELERYKSMVDLTPINTMMATPDGKLVYLNQASTRQLRELEKYLPDRVDNLTGKMIDIFHKNPEVQRKIVSNPKNLPHKAKIRLGDQILDLLVSPVIAPNGDYLGAMVTWDVITARVKLISTLETTSKDLGVSAEELLAVSNTMKASSEETAAQAATVATASEEVNAGINTVVTNIEEMTASIKEITKSTGESSSMSNEAMRMSEDANRIITKLGESSLDIGNVIKVISAIAQQTNLLALNATIEAARAGEAGKGFAVVANEVKELAKETAKATADITKKIETIQGDSKSAVDAISQVTASIEKLNGIASTIAASVEEQAASTSEVNRVVVDSSKAVQGISQNIGEVSTAARSTSEGATQTSDAAKKLGSLATTLTELVNQIRV